MFCTLQFLRALWFALHERVSCLDELDMCTTRLRLLLPGEPVTDNIHVIHPLQVHICIYVYQYISIPVFFQRWKEIPEHTRKRTKINWNMWVVKHAHALRRGRGGTAYIQGDRLAIWSKFYPISDQRNGSNIMPFSTTWAYMYLYVIYVRESSLLLQRKSCFPTFGSFSYPFSLTLTSQAYLACFGLYSYKLH